MTEIPEHLLQRSRERRAAISGGDGDAEDAGATSTQSQAPAVTAAAPAAPSMPAHPAPPAPPEPDPLSPMAEAHLQRRKAPWWAIAVLAALPVWAYIYVGTLEPPPRETPFTQGVDIFAASCATCHGGAGGGGIGPGFTGGAIFETFPDFHDQIEWIALGSSGYAAAHDTATYGANNKPINAGAMPGFGDSLSDADLVFTVLHVRDLGGTNPDPDDQARLEALARIMIEDQDLTLEDAEALLDAGIADGSIVLGGDA